MKRSFESITSLRGLTSGLLSVAAIAAFFIPTTTQATLVYNWSFDAAGSTGPITGTITFDSAVLGTSYSGLTPDSIVIATAPGHVFSIFGQTLGTEVVSNNIVWNTISLPAATPWSITGAGAIIAGSAEFQHYKDGADPFQYTDTFTLGSGAGGSVLTTQKYLPGTPTKNPQLTVQSTGSSVSNSFSLVPEPSSSLLLVGSGAMLLLRRRRTVGR